MSGKLPWQKWFWADWKSDQRLQLVSVAARGVWVEMLGIMVAEEPHGYLKVGPKVILPVNLVGLLGSTTLEEVEGCVAELEEMEIFSRDEEGVIYSRRLVRDEAVRRKRAAGGKKGGNPALIGDSKDKQKVNPRVQSPESESPESRVPEAPPAPKRSKPKTPQQEKVDSVLAVYDEAGINGEARPAGGVCAKWISLYEGKAALLVKDLGVLQGRGHLDNGPSYVFGVLNSAKRKGNLGKLADPPPRKPPPRPGPKVKKWEEPAHVD